MSLNLNSTTFDNKPQSLRLLQMFHNWLGYVALYSSCFVKTRNKDKIIRLVSFTNKRFSNIVSSLVFHLFGFDVYSFWTRRGNPNKPLTELSVLNGFSFQPLTNTSNFVCVITGIPLFESARRLAIDEKSSVPVSIYIMFPIDMIGMIHFFLFIRSIKISEQQSLTEVVD